MLRAKFLAWVAYATRAQSPSRLSLEWSLPRSFPFLCHGLAIADHKHMLTRQSRQHTLAAYCTA